MHSPHEKWERAKGCRLGSLILGLIVVLTLNPRTTGNDDVGDNGGPCQLSSHWRLSRPAVALSIPTESPSRMECSRTRQTLGD